LARQKKIENKKIVVVCDSIRSRENVGSIFRTSDAAGVSKIYLCGYTPTPPHQKISKAALGAENYIPWEKQRQVWRTLEELKKQGFYIVVLEQARRSRNIFKAKFKYPLAIVLGNEVKGLSKKIISRADALIQIPMFGKKESLNVAVALGVAAYQLRMV
jgi:tRNA G18 (ribose-2'-O)-methylase SpoU